MPFWWSTSLSETAEIHMRPNSTFQRFKMFSSVCLKLAWPIPFAGYCFHTAHSLGGRWPILCLYTLTATGSRESRKQWCMFCGICQRIKTRLVLAPKQAMKLTKSNPVFSLLCFTIACGSYHGISENMPHVQKYQKLLRLAQHHWTIPARWCPILSQLCASNSNN